MTWQNTTWHKRHDRTFTDRLVAALYRPHRKRLKPVAGPYPLAEQFVTIAPALEQNVVDDLQMLALNEPYLGRDLAPNQKWFPLGYSYKETLIDTNFTVAYEVTPWSTIGAHQAVDCRVLAQLIDYAPPYQELYPHDRSAIGGHWAPLILLEFPNGMPDALYLMLSHDEAFASIQKQATRLGSLRKYLGRIDEIPARYPLSNFLLEAHIHELPTGDDPAAAMEAYLLRQFGKAAQISLTPLTDWQAGIDIALEFIQWLLEDALDDAPPNPQTAHRSLRERIARMVPFLTQQSKIIDATKPQVTAQVTAEERTELFEQFATFFTQPPDQSWQMQLALPSQEHDYTFGIFTEHLLFAAGDKLYWLYFLFSD